MSGTVRKLLAAGVVALSVPLSVPLSIGLSSPAQAADVTISPSVRPGVEAPFPRAASAENTAPWGLLGLFGLLGLLGLARRPASTKRSRQPGYAEDEGDPFAQYSSAHEPSEETAHPTMYSNAAADEYQAGGQHAAPGRHQQARHAGPNPPPAAAQQWPQQRPQQPSQQWPQQSPQQPPPQQETGWREREPVKSEVSRPQQAEPRSADAATWHAEQPRREEPPDWFAQARADEAGTGQRPQGGPGETPSHQPQPPHGATPARGEWWDDDPDGPEPQGGAAPEEGTRRRF